MQDEPKGKIGNDDGESHFYGIDGGVELIRDDLGGGCQHHPEHRGNAHMIEAPHALVAQIDKAHPIEQGA
jgi:hypothetical protein